ncbi:MAG: T9SS type A sorting domain-containing protein, partial [Prolixibacteraceae bacterium]|nr:T9SS type A sorting domain-containing protein [Prolixibacteraceae bacterium]
VQGANNTQGSVEFVNNNDPYNFIRDGKWHRISVPLNSLVAKGLDLSACGNVFTMSGSNISDIAVDDIYFSENAGNIGNANICYPVSLSVTPKNPSIKTNTSQQFTATATDQFENNTDAFVVWKSDGGTISETGRFSSETEGTYNIWASIEQLSDSTTIKVEQKNTFKNSALANVEIFYWPKQQKLIVDQLEPSCTVSVFNNSGRIIYRAKAESTTLNIDLSQYPASIYLVTVENNDFVVHRKIASY